MHDLFFSQANSESVLYYSRKKMELKVRETNDFFFSSETKHTVRNEGKKNKRKKEEDEQFAGRSVVVGGLNTCSVAARISHHLCHFSVLCDSLFRCFVLLQINNNNNNNRLFGVFSFSCSFFSFLFFLPHFFFNLFLPLGFSALVIIFLNFEN